MTFQNWIEAKKVKEHDLIFTGALKLDEHREVFKLIADRMAERSPGFTEGLAFLEMCTDLILMGYLEELFPSTDQDFEAWRESLRKLRYPQTTALDAQTKLIFEKLPWPQGAKLKFERRGDKYGAEVRFFISQSSDVVKLVAALERVQKELPS